MLDLYRIPRRARIAVCRLLLLGAGLCFGAGIEGAGQLALFGGLACSLAWGIIPERKARPERKRNWR